MLVETNNYISYNLLINEQATNFDMLSPSSVRPDIRVRGVTTSELSIEIVADDDLLSDLDEVLHQMPFLSQHV